MEDELNNVARVVGSYNDVPTSLTSSATVTTIVSGITITLSADKSIWIDEKLTYTILISNDSLHDYVSPKIVDVLDPSLVSFVNGSVTIDGVLADQSKYSFDDSTNTLTIDLDDISISSSCTVTFQVERKK